MSGGWTDGSEGDAAAAALRTALAAAAGGSLLALLALRRRPAEPEVGGRRRRVRRSHPLDATESSFYLLDIPPVTTLTWFDGCHVAARGVLEGRMRLILQKNPWLRGGIEAGWTGSCSLVYHEEESEGDDPTADGAEAPDDIGRYVTLLEGIAVSSGSSPREQNAALLTSPAYSSGVYIGNGPGRPLLRATVVPCASDPGGRFGLVVQMSHVIGDGATYYGLMGMLCGRDEGDATPLDPERVPGLGRKQADAMGRDEAAYFSSFGSTLRIMAGTALNRLRGPMDFDYALLDPAKIGEAKAAAMEEERRLHGDGCVPYVSTNDVLTSWLLTSSTSDVGLMAVNWRGRLDGVTRRHAGNYEGLVYYNPSDCSAPGLIRRSLMGPPYRRAGPASSPLPPWWRTASSTASVVTNWTSFAAANRIEGCVEVSHLPLILPDLVPCHRLRMFVVYRAGEGRVGLCYPPGALKDGALDRFVLR